MKVDGLAVVLVVILLPIILVLTYYIQMQVDTIAIENQYNTKLLNATYDAMSAFEINTANEDLSSVADSLRSIILASNNIFLNTLSTNMGMSNASKQLLQPYIPAVLYTLYDGYYIYSPTEIPKVVEKEESSGEITTTKGYLAYGDEEAKRISISDVDDSTVYGDVIYKKEGGGYTVDKAKAETDMDYVLKSFVQYSAQYKTSNMDITIDYTLDNYLNIVGIIGDIYYTKTGYLIKKGLVNSASIEGDTNILNLYNEYDARNKILGLKTNSDNTTVCSAKYASVTVNGVVIDSNFEVIVNKIREKFGNDIDIKTMEDAEVYLDKIYKEYHEKADTDDNLLKNYIQPIEYEIQQCKAVAYYVSSAIFSNWVYDNLKDLKYSNVKQLASLNDTYETESGVKDVYYNFNSDLKIFDYTQDPEDLHSNFSTHKMEVIKNSIKYNLNLSISAYCKMMGSTDYNLPIISDEEWDKILSNISIVSFLQGIDCGLDIYNNYKIVSSTNNELSVTPDEIYYVESSKFNDGSATFHRIDCPYLSSGKCISFKSKEIKYDKVNDVYDHKNLACYTCINSDNYANISNFESSKRNSTDYYAKIGSLNDINKKVAGYVGLAKERQNIYKTNALSVSQGYKVFSTSAHTDTGNVSVSFPNINLNNVTKLYITFANTQSNISDSVKAKTLKESIFNFDINVNGVIFNNISINLDQKKEQTIILDLPNTMSGIISSLSIMKKAPNYNVGYDIKSIKVIYK